MQETSVKKTALKVLTVTIIINLSLTVFKIITGILGRSSAMLSDALHSASDIFSTLIVLGGILLSTKSNDKSHPYGHERIECISSLILSFSLLIAGFLMGYNGIISLIRGTYLNFDSPTILALIASIVSIGTKEAMFWYTISNAKKTGLVSLKADAWHHRIDAISSVGALFGIGLTLIFNMPIFDIIASVVICAFIIKIAISIFIESSNKLTDKSCTNEEIENYRFLLLKVDGIISIDQLKTRIFGNRIFVDVEIGANENLSLKKAHEIAKTAKNIIESNDKRIKRCMVYVNPVPIKNASK